MKELQRTKVDKFDISQAVSLKNLTENDIIPIEEVFKEYPRVDLNDRKLELFLNGVNLTLEVEDGIYNIYSNNKYIGLGIVKDNLLKRDVII